MASTTPTPTTSDAIEYIDTHTHIDLTLEKLGIPLEAFDQWRADNLLGPRTIPLSNAKAKAKAKAQPQAKGKRKGAAAATSTSSAAVDDEVDAEEHEANNSIRCVYGGCVQVCADWRSYDTSVRLIDTYDDIYGAFGIHPHNAKDYNDEIEAKLIAIMSHPKVVAWGEIGLDYHYNLSPPDVQRRVFARQLELAVQLNKPIVVHTR
jgi:Tat protein secretion system quality control protein TatD with DNase activity